MSYGFVYIMVNEGMANSFKLGCTERSPHARAEELSQPTGVPAPFKVLCYVETKDFQWLEQKMHAVLSEHRISQNREFFDIKCLRDAVGALHWYPKRLSFATSDTIFQYAQIPADISTIADGWFYPSAATAVTEQELAV
jgi:hypothetical protein